jgi:hypothetical protein
MDVVSLSASVIPLGIAVVLKVLALIGEVRSVDGKIEQDRDKIDLLQEHLPLIPKYLEDASIWGSLRGDQDIWPYIEKVVVSSEKTLKLWKELLPTVDTGTVLGKVKRHISTSQIANQLARVKLEIMMNQQMLLTYLCLPRY